MLQLRRGAAGLFRDIGVDSEKPVQTVFYNDGFVYFYLNFTDAQNQRIYARCIIRQSNG